MKKTVSCFTDEKLNELSKQPNTTVMIPHHDITYTAWPSQRVMRAVDDLIQYTRSGVSPNKIIENNQELSEFASKYTIFFKKLTDPSFVNDKGHIYTVKRLITLHSLVENNTLSEMDAKAEAADMALKSLAKRVDDSS